MIEKDKLNLPPRQKRILVRKTDTSLTRSQTSRKKLNYNNKSFNSKQSLDLTFISSQNDVQNPTPTKNIRNTPNLSFLSKKNKDSSPKTDRLDLNQTSTITKYLSQNSNRKTLTPTAQSLQNIHQCECQNRFYTENLKMKQQNQILNSQNKKLVLQLDFQKGKKSHVTDINLKQQLIQCLKENQQLRYQCHYMSTTIQQLQEKLKIGKSQMSQLKSSYDMLLRDLEIYKESNKAMQFLKGCLLDTISNLKSQSQKMSQQIRYLNISLDIKDKRSLECKKIQKQSFVSQELKKKNRLLRLKIMQLTQKVMIDDLVQLTPEKDN